MVYMEYHVPAANVAAICVTFAVVTILPIVNLLYFKVKKGAKISSFFIGGLTFTVFALLLEQIWHTVILALTGSQLTDHIFLYAVYGGLSAGLFEETGRYLAMRFWVGRNRELSAENALMYGAGHGGFESWLVVGMAYLSNLIMVALIHSGGLDAMIAPLDEASAASVLVMAEQLCTLPAWQFLLASLERIGAIFLQMILSYIIYLSIKEKKAAWVILAIGLHALVDAGMVLLANVIPLAVVEVLILVVDAAVGYLLYRKHTTL